jgi:signal transduction histidine kinase
VVFLVGAAAGLWLRVQNVGWATATEDLLYILIFSSFGVVGALVASRQPRNAIGWIFLAITLTVEMAFLSDTYARYSFRVSTAPLPGAVVAAWISSWAWVAFLAPTLTFLPLLFPDGHLPSPRWRTFAWVMGIVEVLAVSGFALAPGRLEGYRIPNPVGIPALRGTIGLLEGPSFLLLIVFAIVSVVSLFLRYRRADPTRRQQIKWFVFAMVLTAAWFLVSGVLEAFGTHIPVVDTIFSALSFASIPVAAGIGILKYRLFDIDVVIRRTLLYGVLAAVITAVYVGIVVGIGALIGSRGSLPLSILATAIIAVGFQPLRERAGRFANRLVYGKRATPYEVLSDFGERLAGSYATDDVLPRLARVAGEGVGAAKTAVWLRLGSELRPEASWPESERLGGAVRLAGDRLPAFDEMDGAFEVRHQGELLGALTVAMPPGQPLTATGEKLLQDLAAHAGLILRNVRLIEELRASRQRLVAAQDEERRRLERNIHDGAQQQLVALAVKLRLVETMAGKDPARTGQMAAQAKAELQEALENLRDLARGIYPPLLADKGLAAALESQARKSAVPVFVESDGVGRFGQEVEAGVYFCVLEALQNASKHAGASRVTIRLDRDDSNLVFQVIDDGHGFDHEATPRGSGLQSMSDRVEVLGGRLEVRSMPGQGTTITGRLPVRP